jgi:hypothetical protein
MTHGLPLAVKLRLRWLLGYFYRHRQRPCDRENYRNKDEQVFDFALNLDVDQCFIRSRDVGFPVRSPGAEIGRSRSAALSHELYLTE